MNLSREERASLINRLSYPNLDGSPKDADEVALLKALQDLEELDKPSAGVDPDPMTPGRLESILRRQLADVATSGARDSAMARSLAEGLKALAWDRLACELHRFVDHGIQQDKKG